MEMVSQLSSRDLARSGLVILRHNRMYLSGLYLSGRHSC
jgi:hypothetical protein